jgi:hypothetical protein
MIEVVTLLAFVGVLVYAIRRLGGAGVGEDAVPVRKRGGPDPAFSAGRDAAHQNVRLRQFFIPMAAEGEPAMRDFYLGIIGLQEMRSPNYPPEPEGFWIASGTRQIYCGRPPRFPVDRSVMPAFPVKRLSEVAERLTERGVAVRWERPTPYVTQVVVTDPAGNQIGLIAA